MISCSYGDFSKVIETGRFTIQILRKGGAEGEKLLFETEPFEISTEWIYRQLLANIKSFYYQRSGFDLTADFAGKWARPAAHMDDCIGFHPSMNREGTWNAHGGWYDAGDYGKYIVNGGVSVATLLLACELMEISSSDSHPMFVGSVFAGEVRAPKLPGKRNYDVYKDYIDDGEAEAQRMVAGGKVRWNMHRRFNGTLGFIGSKDYVEDPFLRDGMDANTNTMNPVISSRNIFADGNWLFYPGDIKLNGQIAMGAADTANAAKIRAINQVFSEVGLDALEQNFGRQVQVSKGFAD